MKNILIEDTYEEFTLDTKNGMLKVQVSDNVNGIIRISFPEWNSDFYLSEHLIRPVHEQELNGPDEG